MKIVRFLGGLGNQMFQYAFYKYLATKYEDLYVDTSLFEHYDLHYGLELEQIFGLTLKRASAFTVQIYDPAVKNWWIRKLRRLAGLKRAYYEEITDYSFDPSLLSDPSSKLYWGYWQNIAYILPIADTLKKDFQFKPSLNEQNTEILNDIIKHNSVSIHIRRGDYIGHPLFDNICDVNYYQQAISMINEQQHGLKYFIFSNDIAWAKANLNILNADLQFVSNNNGDKSYIDMQLMSNCKHHIIANSSFSWWAAWLNNNQEKIVIAPKKWINKEHIDTKGLFPSKWITI